MSWRDVDSAPWDASLTPERTLTEEERESVEDVLFAAADWQAGELPITEAAKFGIVPWNGRPSPWYTRFVAIRTTPKGDPRRIALIAMCEKLDKLQGGVHTQFGRFGQGEVDRVNRETAYLLDRGIVRKGIL